MNTDVDVLCIPSTAPLLAAHPDVHRVISYDKRGDDGFLSIARSIRATGYDLCISPHRSFRSALLARASGAPCRVTFDTSAGGFLYTNHARYDARAHEVVRTLSLLELVTSGGVDYSRRPSLHPTRGDEDAARRILTRFDDAKEFVVIAPGSVWETKRWTEEGFIDLGCALAERYGVVLIGGASDRALCERIAGVMRREGVGEGRVLNAAGALDFPASAALIGMARVVISNDSAPVHLASAMGTPVVEIFGATIPDFGFTPFGVPHEVVDAGPMECRPCGIHGGHRCPIGTFDCMRSLRWERVRDAVMRVLQS